MKLIGLPNKKDIPEVLELIKNQGMVLSKSVFDNEFLKIFNEKNIEIDELIDIEKLRNLKKFFPTFLELTDYLKSKLTAKNYDFYISTSINPTSSDVISVVFNPKKVINFQTTEDLLAQAFNGDYNFNYGLPVFKQVDFFYFYYHFGNFSKFDTNFVIPNIPVFHKDVFENIEGKILKVSDIAYVYCFIPENLIYKTMLDYLASVMVKLRYNCQWDRIQTSQSIKNHLIEEAYEILDSIEKNNNEKFKNELGDLLLQIIFHSQIQSDFKDFNFYDVLKSLVKKLINRHPHVFNDNELHTNIEKILVDWEKTKAKENKNNTIDLPKSMPSLLKMYLLYRKIKRLKLIPEFDKFVKEKLVNLQLSNQKIYEIFELLHNFYLENSENLESMVNNFLEELISNINESKILKIEN